MKRSLAAFAFAILSPAALAAPAVPTGFHPIEVRTLPITVFQRGSTETTFGALRFLGGIVMQSPDPAFGSWSGLDFEPDGRTLVAVADTGEWLSATLDETDHRPVALTGAKIGPMLGDNGEPPAHKVVADAEGLRLITGKSGTDALVSFEQTVAVRGFRGPDFAAAKPLRLTLPKFVSGLRRNQGLEALAIAPPSSPIAGAIVAIAERSLDTGGNHRGFILTGTKPGTFSVRRTDDFDISDAVFLPGGDLLVLERRFSFSAGFAMRIRRIAAAKIHVGALLDGPVLIEADDRYEIDNMEGIAVRALPSGESVITLVSDDNHGFLQRSILLQFLLSADSAG